MCVCVWGGGGAYFLCMYLERLYRKLTCFSLCRQIFCDFGENFAISDTTGEQPISVIISAVSKETKSVVTCSDETRHNFQSGDYVTFTEVQVSDKTVCLGMS